MGRCRALPGLCAAGPSGAVGAGRAELAVKHPGSLQPAPARHSVGGRDLTLGTQGSEEECGGRTGSCCGRGQLFPARERACLAVIWLRVAEGSQQALGKPGTRRSVKGGLLLALRHA